AEDGIRVDLVTGVQTCALPIYVQISLQLSERHQPPRSFWPRLFLAFASRSCMSAGTWGRSVEPKRSASTCTVPAILSSVCAERRSEERRVGKEGGARGRR